MTDAADAAAAGDSLSPAEQAYFDTKGEAVAGLGEAAPAADAAIASPSEPTKGSDASAANEDAAAENDGKPPNAGQWVRHGALHAERERRKKAEADLASEREFRARVDARLLALNGLDEAKPVDAGPPDPATDMVGYVRHLDRKLAGLEGQMGQTVRASAAEREQAALNHAYLSDARGFVERNPDFIAGYRHLQHSRDQELALAGHDDPAVRLEIIKAEERDIVIRALQNGASPAERIYALAKARGFRNDSGETGRAAAAERIETIQRGQAAAKSLSSVGGTSGEALTAEALANMPQEEFNTLYERLKSGGAGRVRATFGG